MAGKGSLDYNSLFFFRYKAKGADEGTLHRYDRAPLVIFLDFRKNSALGVNLHWIPSNQRRQFLDIVEGLAKKIGKGSRKRIVPRLYYETLKQNSRLGKLALKAIRSYFFNRMTSAKRISPELWENVLKIPKYKARKVRRGKGFKT